MKTVVGNILRHRNSNNTKISFEENKNIFDAYDFVEKIHQNVMLFWQSFSI